MVSEFLSEEWKKKLKEMGGVEDHDGLGGLRTEVAEEEPEERLRQKGKSAASLYLESQKGELDDKYEAYGCSDSDELISDRNWSGKVVLMMQ